MLPHVEVDVGMIFWPDGADAVEGPDADRQDVAPHIVQKAGPPLRGTRSGKNLGGGAGASSEASAKPPSFSQTLRPESRLRTSHIIALRSYPDMPTPTGLRNALRPTPIVDSFAGLPT